MSDGTTSRRVVVAGAVQDAAGRVLAAQRSHPPAAAGFWELPGGKVEPGETEPAALVRELQEELALTVRPGERVGGDWPCLGPYVLHLWTARPVDPHAEPTALEHTALRWVAPADLLTVDWLPGDAPMVAELRSRLLGR